MMLSLLILAIVLVISQSFSINRLQTRFHRQLVNLQMAAEADPLDAIRAKMQSNPNYNPLSDPEAAQVIENLIPAEFRDVLNAIERLRVAVKDGTTGPDAATDLDKDSKSFNFNDLISTPNSQFFKKGRQVDGKFDPALIEELKADLRKAYPDIPVA